MSNPTEKLKIRTATRTGVRPLIVFYSESGNGKTYSALLLARGLAGANGKVIMIDTESGRGELYADVPIFRNYDVISLTEPFSPARHIEALSLAQETADCIILDSGSHEWEGIGGVLDMAGENEHSSGRPGLHNWRTPKFEHSKFVAALMRSTVPLVVCLRAKYKTKQRKDDRGKTQIVKDDYTSPIQAEDFIFEATCHGEIMPDHSLRLTKWSHPKLKSCFPEEGKPVEIKHGEAIAAWCGNVSEPAKPKPIEPSAGPDLAILKKKLWDATKDKHFGDVGALEQFLWDEGFIDTTENLAGLDAKRVDQVIKMFEKKFPKSNPLTPAP